MNQKYKVLLNNVKLLNLKCSVYFPDIHDFIMYDEVYDLLKSDVLDKFKVFSVTVQKSIFDDRDNFVTVWLQ